MFQWWQLFFDRCDWCESVIKRSGGHDQQGMLRDVPYHALARNSELKPLHPDHDQIRREELARESAQRREEGVATTSDTGSGASTPALGLD